VKVGRVTDLLEDLVDARVGWVSGLLRSWYADSDLREHLRSAMSVEEHRVGNLEFGKGFRDGVGLHPTSDPLDWTNRHLDLADEGWAVTGIRYRGGDSLRPFVDVVATTEAPTPDGLARVASAVVPAYDAFEPRCLRVDAPDPSGLVEQLAADDRFGPACAVDMFVVAGPVEELRAQARASAYDRVVLRAGDPEPLAKRVAAVYADLAEQRPDLAMWANPEDAESLAECAEEGLLFEVLVDGEPAGVVASMRYDGHGMVGFSVQELCLDGTHRGRHIAAAALQRLVDELPAGDDDVLWGTIHPENLPSLRNALSVGRVIVGGYVWVTPIVLPGMDQSVTRG
jgi:L-amino acid N-acyltransferase YncA